MWAVAQALTTKGVELHGDLHLHCVVGEEMMEHPLGTTALLEAGFRADAAIVTEPTSYPRPLTVSPVAAGVWILRIVVQGKSTHCGNRPLAIRPGGPGDAIGVNALEKAVDVVTALQELEREWGTPKPHPCFSPGFFTIGANVFHADTGVSFPAYLPNRAPIEYVIWYPPQESAEEVAREIEALLLAVCRLDTWLATTRRPSSGSTTGRPWSSTWEHELEQTMARGHEAATGRAGRPTRAPSARSTSAPPATARSTRRRASRRSSTVPAI